jgi:hypothetical protein
MCNPEVQLQISEAQNLRQEIIESVKARSDFVKWKLIGVGALGAVGLGLGGTQNIPHSYLVLPIIPLLCLR